jgi:hypothetical protein
MLHFAVGVDDYRALLAETIPRRGEDVSQLLLTELGTAHVDVAFCRHLNKDGTGMNLFDRLAVLGIGQFHLFGKLFLIEIEREEKEYDHLKHDVDHRRQVNLLYWSCFSHRIFRKTGGLFLVVFFNNFRMAQDLNFFQRQGLHVQNNSGRFVAEIIEGH